MRRLIFSLASLLILTSCTLAALTISESSIDETNKMTAIKEKNIKDPVRWYVQHIRLEEGDSVISDLDILGKVHLDFNNDGIKDWTLTWYPGLRWGHASLWAFFVGNQDGTFNYLGNILFNEGNTELLKLQPGKTRFSFYYQYTGFDGEIFTYEISKDCIKEISSKPIKFDENGCCTTDDLNTLTESIRVEYCSLREYIKNKNCRWKKDG